MYHSNSCMKYSCIFSSDHNTLFRVIKQNSLKITILTQHLKNRRSMKYKKPISRCRSWILKIYYESIFANASNLNPLQDGLFRDCSRIVGGGGWGAFLPSPFFPKICHTYPTIMKLGTVIPYLRKIQKMYKSRDTFLEFC